MVPRNRLGRMPSPIFEGGIALTLCLRRKGDRLPVRETTRGLTTQTWSPGSLAQIVTWLGVVSTYTSSRKLWARHTGLDTPCRKPSLLTMQAIQPSILPTDVSTRNVLGSVRRRGTKAYKMKMKQMGKRDNEPSILARSANSSASSLSVEKVSIVKRK